MINKIAMPAIWIRKTPDFFGSFRTEEIPVLVIGSTPKSYMIQLMSGEVKKVRVRNIKLKEIPQKPLPEIRLPYKD